MAEERAQRASRSRDTIVADLHAAFEHDPVQTWVFPDARKRRRYGATYFRLHAARSARQGLSWHTDGGAVLWDGPDAWRFDTREELAMAASGVLGAGLRRGMEVGRAFQEVEAAHPREPHLYLAILGVRPERRGRGIGAALLEPGLARADADGLPCYLESSNPLNVGLYERHGFEITREHHLPDGPLLTFMWRRPG